MTRGWRTKKPEKEIELLKAQIQRVTADNKGLNIIVEVLEVENKDLEETRWTYKKKWKEKEVLIAKYERENQRLQQLLDLQQRAMTALEKSFDVLMATKVGCDD
jgi:predicted RNase H-like nuclease (RuvC/YqgF family)